MGVVATIPWHVSCGNQYTTTMFVRFRQTRSRLQLSLIETRRVDGKVRHEHIASLGSVIQPPTVADRGAFWSSLHERMARLSNRLDAAAQAKLMGEVHARVPIVPADERGALQLDAARSNAMLWSPMRDYLAATANDKQRLAENATAEAAADKAAADTMDRSAKTAQAHAEAIERGETVEGAADKPEDLRALLKRAGFTAADLRDDRLLASISEEHFDEFLEETFRLQLSGDHRRHRQAARMILRKHGEG
jgi:hypothetical protein